MSTVRINELARELEVKSKAILDALTDVGITEKKTHSSSVEDDEAEKIRKHFAAKSGSAGSRERAAPSELRPKIDLSRISKPGDVLRLLKEREQPPQAGQSFTPPRPATTVATPPAARTSPPPASPVAAGVSVREEPAVSPPPEVQPSSASPVSTSPEVSAPERPVVAPPPAPKAPVQAPAPHVPRMIVPPGPGPVYETPAPPPPPPPIPAVVVTPPPAPPPAAKVPP